MGRRGSSELIEFLIALFVGLLAVLGATLCIEISPTDEGCTPITSSYLLPIGCTLNGQRDIERQICSHSPCSCSSDMSPGSLCCCWAIQETLVQGVQCIKELQTPQVSSALHCGCEVCHDIPVRVTLNVQHRDNQEPVAAAQIYQKNGGNLQLLGLTDNFGRFIHSDVVGARELTLHIIAPNFIAITLESLTLRPDRQQTTITVNLIPLMNLDVGLGGSPITVHLGTMATVSAPPSAFTMMDTNETYNDLVMFKGTIMTSSDDNEFIGVPGNSFMGWNKVSNEMEQYGVLLVTYLQFQGVYRESLSSDQIRLGVSVQNRDGNLPPLYLLYYDEDRRYWVNLGPLNPTEPPRKKRQSDPPAAPVFVEMDNVPVDVFIAVAANENANCWLQARTFAESGIGDAFPSTVGQGNGPLVSLQQRSDISGNRFLFQFGTDTGNIFNTILAPNAICLPLRCSNFTTASLEARINDVPIESPSLLPISFNKSMFDMAPSAPLKIGTIFTWDELFFPSDPATPNPFYPDFTTCQMNAQEVNPERGDYFGFQIQPMINFALSTEMCFINCGRPRVSSNQGVVIEPFNNTQFNATIIFHCEEGLIPDTVIEAVCGSTGVWSPNPAFCNSAPAVPINTHIIDQSTDFYPEGTNITIQCDDVPHATLTTVCHADGIWRPHLSELDCSTIATSESATETVAKVVLSTSSQLILTGVICSFVFFFLGVLVGVLCHRWGRVFVKPCTGDIEHLSPTDTPAGDAPVVYEEVTTDSHSRQNIELEENVAYVHI